MPNPRDYHLHSGGAKGADLAWDAIGRAYGIPGENIYHYRPIDYTEAPAFIKGMIDEEVKQAAINLHRPYEFKGVDLVRRNSFQVANSKAVFAIGYLIHKGEADNRGFVNKSDHRIVSGGTGWAVEMALIRKMPVYVFDQTTEQWYKFRYMGGEFYPYEGVPELYEHFAGIGTRELSPAGELAIKDVYAKTFDHLNQ